MNSLSEEYRVQVLRNPETGKPTDETWKRGGLIDRVGGGPAVTEWDNEGRLKAQRWYVEHRPHREDGPATIHYDSDTGTVTWEEYFRHGKLHRDGNLPATIRKDLEGGDYGIGYYIDGQRHRSDGPAETFYSSDEGTITESWWRYGQRHRADGPAMVIRKHDTGEVVEQEYYRHGQLIRPPAPLPGPA